MKGLVLAEKPSLMRAIQSAYKTDKYPFSLDFASFRGHLMELAQPAEYTDAWTKWTLDVLPMIPDKFRYEPIDKAAVDKLVNIIKTGHYDFLVNCCDAGREGELIFWSFYEANHLALPVKRLWSSTTVEKDLQAALHHLRPASDFDNLRASAKFRAEFDWLTGFNFSRAISLKLKRKANIGRVVTPTLKMVVDRELEIEGFQSRPFWEISAEAEKGGERFCVSALAPPTLKDGRFEDKAKAEATMSAIETAGRVELVNVSRKAIKAPTLYSTLELQKDAYKYCKFRASKTDAIAQELYESGFISYPRTECRYLPTSLVPEIQQMLLPLKNFPELEIGLKMVTPDAIKAATSGKLYVDDGKLTDHHAIVPTSAVFDPIKLNADQRKLYLLIAKRFLSIFLPPYTVDNAVAVIDSGGTKLRAKGRVIIEKGFSVLYDDKSKDTKLPALKKGDIVSLKKPVLREGKTQPPNRYTEETLLDAMEHAGRFVSAKEQRSVLKEASGLGTGATRSGILSKLESTQMCQIESGFYRPTQFGMALIKAIGSRSICSPALTAEWEALLHDVESHGHPELFQQKMLDFIRCETADIIAHVNGDLSTFGFTVLGNCPLCQSRVLMTENYYKCEKYKDDKEPCTFIVSRKQTAGTTISEEEMRTMLSGKITSPKQLTAKDGTKYIAPLLINEKGRVAPAISRNEPSAPLSAKKIKTIKGICKCPLCSDGVIYRGNKYYICTNRGSTCEYAIAINFSGAELTEEDIKILASGGITKPKTFTWKSGAKGTARLKQANKIRQSGGYYPVEFIFA